MTSRYLLIPFAVQMLCMTVDEFYYHWQRKLPRWERLGHPLDTSTVLLCLAWILSVSPTTTTVFIYTVLCIFSCLFVMKDEPIHTRFCSGGEHWLHAMLFTLHPLVLLSAGLLWPAVHGKITTLNGLIRYEGFEKLFLTGNTFLTILFGLYQLIYWNFLWKPSPKNPSAA